MAEITREAVIKILENPSGFSISYSDGSNLRSLSMHDSEKMRQRWKEIQTQIDVYAFGNCPLSIEKNRPQEVKESMEWRKTIFKNIATPAYNQAVTQIKQIIKNARLSFELTTSNSNSIEDGAEKEISDIVNLEINGMVHEEFLNSELVDYVINNPNNFIIVLPEYVYKKLNQDFVEVNFIDVSNVLYYDVVNKVLVFSLDEYISSEKRTYLLTESKMYESYREFRQNEKNGDYEDVIIEYTIDKDFWFQIGGKSAPFKSDYNKRIVNGVNISLFDGAFQFGDLALNAHSDTQAVLSLHNYPRMSILADTCPACMGSKRDPNDFEKECNTCHSTGLVIASGATNIIARPRYNPSEGLNNMQIGDEIKYYHVGKDAIDASREAWEFYFKEFKKALCIVENDNLKTADSGVAYDIQMRPLFDKMQEVGTLIVSVYEKIMKSIVHFRGHSTGFKLTIPKSFAILSEKDSMVIVEKMFQLGVNTIFRRDSILSYVEKYVGANTYLYQTINALEKYDTLFYYNINEKNDMLERGVISLQEYRFSMFCLTILLSLDRNKIDLNSLESIKNSFSNESNLNDVPRVSETVPSST